MAMRVKTMMKMAVVSMTPRAARLLVRPCPVSPWASAEQPPARPWKMADMPMPAPAKMPRMSIPMPAKGRAEGAFSAMVMPRPFRRARRSGSRAAMLSAVKVPVMVAIMVNMRIIP